MSTRLPRRYLLAASSFAGPVLPATQTPPPLPTSCVAGPVHVLGYSHRSRRGTKQHRPSPRPTSPRQPSTTGSPAASPAVCAAAGHPVRQFTMHGALLRSRVGFGSVRYLGNRLRPVTGSRSMGISHLVRGDAVHGTREMAALVAVTGQCVSTARHTSWATSSPRRTTLLSTDTGAAVPTTRGRIDASRRSMAWRSPSTAAPTEASSPSPTLLIADNSLVYSGHTDSVGARGFGPQQPGRTHRTGRHRRSMARDDGPSSHSVALRDAQS